MKYEVTVQLQIEADSLPEADKYLTNWLPASDRVRSVDIGALQLWGWDDAGVLRQELVEFYARLPSGMEELLDREREIVDRIYLLTSGQQSHRGIRKDAQQDAWIIKEGVLR